MFEQEEIEKLQKAGFSVNEDGSVSNSDGAVVPSEIYSQAFQTDIFEGKTHVSVDNGFEADNILRENYKKQVAEMKSSAKSEIEEFLSSPGINNLDLGNPFVRRELKKLSKRGLINYDFKKNTVEDFVNEIRNSSDSPVIQELLENYKARIKRSNKSGIETSRKKGTEKTANKNNSITEIDSNNVITSKITENLHLLIIIPFIYIIVKILIGKK